MNHECNQCGHSWKPKATTRGAPASCPRCKRYDWMEPKKSRRMEGKDENDTAVRGEVGSGSGSEASGRKVHSNVRTGSDIPELHRNKVPSQELSQGSISGIGPRPDESVGGDAETLGAVCGFVAFNESDGENYRCNLAAHGPRVKHGHWVKL